MAMLNNQMVSQMGSNGWCFMGMPMVTRGPPFEKATLQDFVWAELCKEPNEELLYHLRCWITSWLLFGCAAPYVIIERNKVLAFCLGTTMYNWSFLRNQIMTCSHSTQMQFEFLVAEKSAVLFSTTRRQMSVQVLRSSQKKAGRQKHSSGVTCGNDLLKSWKHNTSLPSGKLT